MQVEQFYLGTHEPSWLERAGVPLFVSRRRLMNRRTFPRAAASWALDSGGFTELSMHGGWELNAREYAAEVRRYAQEIGALEWAAPQDWMCEPAVLARTGLTVDVHQSRTLRNYLELRSVAPELPFVPVLQGWTCGDYFRHAEAYEAAGVDLAACPVVGVGTVCRRQHTARAGQVLALLHDDGLRLHAFGFKVQGLQRSHAVLASADSMAWSMEARRARPLPGHSHASCANCMEYALEWRGRVLGSLPAA